jgi:hypothetical protein
MPVTPAVLADSFRETDATLVLVATPTWYAYACDWPEPLVFLYCDPSPV